MELEDKTYISLELILTSTRLLWQISKSNLKKKKYWKILNSHMRISVFERNQHGGQSRENVTFWTKNQLKMAEFQLVQVGKVGK